jgi:YD repeat-containing protein
MTKVRYTHSGAYKEVEYSYSNQGELTRVLDWLNPGVSPGHYFEYSATTGLMTRYRDFDDNLSGTRKKLDYEYNVAGQVTKMTDYDGNITTYAYTDTGELSTLTAPGSKVWDFDYNALHQRTQVTYPNGMKAVYAYDTANRLTKIEYNIKAPLHCDRNVV